MTEELDPMANAKQPTRVERELFRARLDRIEQFLVKRANAKTLPERFGLMNELFCWGKHLGMSDYQDGAEIEQVRQRWVRLKSLYERKNSTKE